MHKHQHTLARNQQRVQYNFANAKIGGTWSFVGNVSAVSQEIAFNFQALALRDFLLLLVVMMVVLSPMNISNAHSKRYKIVERASARFRFTIELQTIKTIYVFQNSKIS